ncbi:MAG: translocation/assembly module TamB, partial [Bacteroidales bacterium]|nr:translocation/assembly module TamB [Bacteroidales bacterium]
QNEVVYDFEISSGFDGNNIVFKVPSRQLIMNGVQWQLDTPDLFLFNRTAKTISPSLRMHTNNSFLHLLSDGGNGMNSYNCEFSDVKITSLIRDDILPGKPAGLISGTVDYGVIADKGKKINTDLSFRDVSWSDLDFNSITLKGYFISEMPGNFKVDMTARLDTALIVVKGEKPAAGNRTINAEFTEMPINTFQPFVRDYLSEIRGDISGYFNISSDKDIENYSGELIINDANFRINTLNLKYRIPDDKILFSGKKMIFNNSRVLDSLNNELFIDGSVDFTNTKSIETDLEISSSELQVMNTGEDEKSSFYGNIFIDSRLSVKGPLLSPVLRGEILLSKGTEVFYRKMENLNITESEKIVRFVSSRSSGDKQIEHIKDVQIVHNNASVETIIKIDPTTIINFNLSERLFNIDLMIQGGGVLNYSMLVNNRINLAGKYEISKGTADLKMVGWPNKGFRITKGGFIRWDGNFDDPEVNFEALNTVRSSYTNPVDGKDRNVDFNVTLKLSNRLSDLNVLFAINTPDQYLMSIINTLSPEEQMKQAITILLFQKIDLPGISTSTDYMTEQVNQLIETQLNQLTKTTIKGVDISFGIDSYVQSTQAGGEETKTSLSYEVKRALLDDRAQIEFSGRINDFNKQPGASDISFNNFSFEYRLDSASTKFLKVYNEHTYEDVFEGEVTKTGVGITYRKSYRFFRDIWKREKRNRKGKKR